MTKELRILIVEDSETDASLLVQTVQKDEYDVIFDRVDTPNEMSRALQEGDWDLVLADFQLKNFNGYQAIDIYNQSSVDIPFLFVCEEYNESAVVQAIKTGAHDVLTKQNLSSLVPAIKRELQQAEIRQKQNETLRDLEENEEKFRLLVEHSQSGILTVDDNFRFTYVNNRLTEILGYTYSELIGSDFRDFIHVDDLDMVADRYIRRQRGEEVPQKYEFRVIRKDGSWRYVDLTSAVIRSKDGDTKTMAQLLDITDYKIAEQEIRLSSESLERRAIQLHAAAEVARDAAAVQHLDELLQRAVNLVSERFGFYYVGIYLIEEHGKYAVLTAASGQDGQQLIKDKYQLKVGDGGLVGQVTSSGEPLISQYVDTDHLHLSDPRLTKTRSEMTLPLQVGGRIIGALDVQSQQVNSFDDDDIQVLQIMTDQLAVAIENARLLNESQRQTQELAGLYESALATNSIMEQDALLERLNEQVQKLIAPDAFGVALYLENSREFTMVYAKEAGEDVPDLIGTKYPIVEGGLTGWVIENRETLLITNTQSDELPTTPKKKGQEILSWLGVPLIGRDRLLGVVSIQSFTADAFDEGHQRFLEALAAQVSITFENSRLFEAERHRRQEAETLRQITRTLSSSLELNKVLNLILDRLKDVLPYDTATIQIAKDNHLFIHDVSGEIPQDRIGQQISIDKYPDFASILNQGHSIVHKDLQSIDTALTSLEPERVRSWLGVPLSAKGKNIGILTLGSVLMDDYSESDISLATGFADQAAIAIQNAELFEGERNAREQAEMLRDVVQAVGASMELDVLLKLILQQLRRVLTFDTASVLILGNSKSDDRWAGIGYENEILVRKNSLNILRENEILKQLEKTRESVIIPDAREYGKWVWIPGAEHVRSFLGIPILSKDNMIGAFYVDSSQVDFFTQEDAKTAQTLAQHIAIAIENVRLIEAERAQLNLAQSLQQVDMLLTSEIGLDDVLERILELLKQVVDYDSASIQLLEEDNHLYLAAGQGFPNFERAKEIVQNLSDPLLKENSRIYNLEVISDTLDDERWIPIDGHEYIRSWIGAPLVVRGKYIGVLNLDNKTSNAYDQNIGQTALAFANQAAIAIENAQLFEAEKHARERAEALSQAANAISSTLSLDQIITAVLEQLARVLPYDSANVMFIQDDQIYLMAGHGYENFTRVLPGQPVSLKKDNKTLQDIIHRGKPVIIQDVRKDKGWVETPISGHVRSWMGVPLIIRDQVIGFIGIDRVIPGDFLPEQVSIAKAFAAHTSTAIENARLFTAEEQRASRLETLQQVSMSLTESLEPAEVLRKILEGVFKLIPNVLDTHIFLYKEGQLTFGSARQANDVPELKRSYTKTKALAYEVAINAERMVIHDIASQTTFRKLQEIHGSVKSILSLPLKIGERVIGILNIALGKKNAVKDDDLQLLQLLSDQAGLVIENSRLFDQSSTERLHLALLYDVGQAVSTALNENEILERALELTCKAIKGASGQAGIYDPKENRIRLNAFYGRKIEHLEDLDLGVKLQLDAGADAGLDAWVANNRLSVNLPNVRENKYWIPIKGLDDDVVSVMIAPILEGNHLLGTLGIYSTEVNAFSQNELDLLEGVCQQVALALSNARRYQDVNRLVDMLAVEQYRLENLIERMPVGVLLLNREQQIQIANPIGREILAMLSPSRIGQKLTHLGNYSLQTLIERQTDPIPVEITVKRPLDRVFEVQVRPLGSESRQYVVMLRDVTQEREFKAQIHMQDRLATVGQLAAGIAHDFNNIMAAIMVYTDLLLMDTEHSSGSRDRLTIIQQQVQRAASLIRQILDFSRRSIMEENVLDLLPFIKEMEKLLHRTLPENIQISLEYIEDQYIVLGDPTRIQQVFMNLAINARDAMPKGGKLKFNLSGYELLPADIPPTPDMSPGQYVCLTISDSGEGIEPDLLPHIFEPFFTTKPVGEGTGLGLAQVYGIIKQHGGAIAIHSHPGEGTTFEIYLPRLPQTAEPVEDRSQSSDLDGKGSTVLLVEDDPAARIALESLLEVHNYSVLQASNGLSALEIIQEKGSEISWVISDMVMPEMGGVELYKAIEQKWPEIKFMFITGHPMGENTQILLDRSKVRWLQKPFSIEDFSEVLQSYSKIPMPKRGSKY